MGNKWRENMLDEQAVEYILSLMIVWLLVRYFDEKYET